MTTLRTLIYLSAACALLACSSDAPAGDTATADEPAAAADAPAAAEAHASMPTAPGLRVGAVKETMTSGGYTYALLDTSDGEVWVAGPQSELAVGDRVETAPGSEMRDFTSSTLNRTFPQVFFVTAIRPEGSTRAAGMAEASSPHPGGLAAATAPSQVAPVERLEGGMTVVEVLSGAAEGGAEVALRGRVVKVNRGILGADWLHLRDGTGVESEGNHDLTVTTAPGVAVSVGDVVVVRGKLARDKDFGAGYVYPFVGEEAVITAE